MKASSTRYTIFSLLFLIALINYIDRGALSFAANAISQEFHFSKVQLGAVLGYFGFGYLCGSLCGGFLADRLGTKKVWLMAGILWSLLEIATAWAGELGMALFGLAFLSLIALSLPVTANGLMARVQPVEAQRLSLLPTDMQNAAIVVLGG